VRGELISAYSISDFATEVRAGLTGPGQKELPSKYLYDQVGSALFDVITALPEYGLTRAGERLLRQHAEAIIELLLPGPVIVAELGSGTGRKARWIVEALARHQRTVYHPIEISPTALEQCTKEMSQVPSVSVVGFEQSYLDGLLSVAASRRPKDRLLVLFLGSTIGNFDRDAGEGFLQEVRRVMAFGDALLLATDLEKPLAQLLPAYDDPLGVTAAFNLNLLARINRELAADFDLGSFRHHVRYDSSQRRIEMHLFSLRPQRISVPGADCSVWIDEGETIWTESSHKYRLNDIERMAASSGFRPTSQWVDQEWPFAQTLLIAN
jgi:L-histidine Nalpha-methyltransferase